MPVDASIYNNLNTQGYNPLTTAGNAASLANTIQKNALLHTQNQSAKVGLSQQQATLGMQFYDNINKVAGGLATDPDLNYDKVVDAMASGVAGGWLPAQQAAAELNNVPQNPNEIRQWARIHQINALDAKDRLAQQFGTNATQDTGSQILNGVVQPAFAGGGFQPNTATTLTLSPAQKAARVNTVAFNDPLYPNGTPLTVPTSSTVSDTGYALPKPGQKSGGLAPPNNPNQAAIDADDEKKLVAATPSVQNNATPNSASAFAKSSDGAIPAGMVPGYADQVKDSQGRIAQVKSDAGQAVKSTAILNQILDISKNGAGSGPVSNAVTPFYNVIANLTGVTSGLTQAADQQKQLAKYMSQNLEPGDSRSDNVLSALRAGNVSPDQLPQTVQKLVGFALAAQKGKIAKLNAMQKYIGSGLDPEKENEFNKKWTNAYDQRAMELHDLPVAEATAYFNALPKDTRKTVINKYKEMHEVGAF